MVKPSSNQRPTQPRPKPKGYVFHRGAGAATCPFQARIRLSGRTVSLGYFSTEREASAAHRAALKLKAAAEPLLAGLGAVEVALRIMQAHARYTSLEGPKMPPAQLPCREDD